MKKKIILVTCAMLLMTGCGKDVKLVNGENAIVTFKEGGISSNQLYDALKERVDFSEFAYITLETDAVDNEAANKFYVKNGFTLEREYETREGRKMNEYRYRG